MTATSGKGRTRVEAYVEAVLALRAIEQAIKDDGETTKRLVARTEARAALHRAESQLNGSLMGAARRALAERTTKGATA